MLRDNPAVPREYTREVNDEIERARAMDTLAAAALPSAALFPYRIIYVNDETKPAFSDGSAWLRIAVAADITALETDIATLETNVTALQDESWTYLTVAGSDFTTSSGTAVDVTGLAFTPGASTQYEFEAMLLLRTASATIGPRPGLSWPTGMTDGVAQVQMPTSATADVLVYGNINAALLSAVGGLPNTTQSYPAFIRGTVIAGSSPSGNVKVQLASESAGTTVTAKIGSFLRYREI